MIADGHSSSAAAADGQALQQSGAFAGWAVFVLSSMGGGVQGQGLLVGLEGFPADVAGMGVKDKGGPLLSGEHLDGTRPQVSCDPCFGHRRTPLRSVDCAACAAPASGEGACRRAPLCGRRCGPVLERQIFVGEGLDDGTGRAGAGEGREQVAHRLHDAGVGIEHDTVGRVIDETDRERHLELTAPGLGQDAAAQAGADEVELCLLCRTCRYANQWRHRCTDPEP